jgi:hypothetical protein
MMREEIVPVNIEVNDRLMCNWGAMFPVEYMTVIRIDEDANEVVAENDEEIRRFNPEHIREMGYRTANGSPIGVFLMKGEA